MDALELGVGCLIATLLAAILYQQVATSQDRIVAPKTAKALVVLLSLMVIVLGAISVVTGFYGGAQ